MGTDDLDCSKQFVMEEVTRFSFLASSASHLANSSGTMEIILTQPNLEKTSDEVKNRWVNIVIVCLNQHIINYLEIYIQNLASYIESTCIKSNKCCLSTTSPFFKS